jgi:hypothetical protein
MARRGKIRGGGGPISDLLFAVVDRGASRRRCCCHCRKSDPIRGRRNDRGRDGGVSGGSSSFLQPIE